MSPASLAQNVPATAPLSVLQQLVPLEAPLSMSAGTMPDEPVISMLASSTDLPRRASVEPFIIIRVPEPSTDSVGPLPSAGTGAAVGAASTEGGGAAVGAACTASCAIVVDSTAEGTQNLAEMAVTRLMSSAHSTDLADVCSPSSIDLVFAMLACNIIEDNLESRSFTQGFTVGADT